MFQRHYNEKWLTPSEVYFMTMINEDEYRPPKDSFPFRWIRLSLREAPQEGQYPGTVVMGSRNLSHLESILLSKGYELKIRPTSLHDSVFHDQQTQFIKIKIPEKYREHFDLLLSFLYIRDQQLLRIVDDMFYLTWDNDYFMIHLNRYVNEANTHTILSDFMLTKYIEDYDNLSGKPDNMMDFCLCILEDLCDRLPDCT